MPSAGPCNPVDAARYNRLMTAEFESIRDFLILHFHANRRDDTDYWRHLAAMPVPDALAERLEVWRRSGRVYREADELFLKTSWLAVLEGQAPPPEGWDAIAAGVEVAEGRSFVEGVARVTAAAAAQMPDHAAFIAARCRSDL